MRRKWLWGFWLAVAVLYLETGAACAQKEEKRFAAPSGQEVVATLDGKKITRNDVKAYFAWRQIPEGQQGASLTTAVNEIIDRRLIASFLESRKFKASQKEMEVFLDQAVQGLEKHGGSLEEVLKKSGLTMADLKRELGLAMTWRVYVRSVVTEEQLKRHFEQNKIRYDGTRVRARQIFIDLPDSPTPEEVETVRSRLAEIRKEIISKAVSFADAARQHSESPSKSAGGDMGAFSYLGIMPESIKSVAFQLKVNEISEPFQTPFGMHLLEVTEIIPGDLSVEDSRNYLMDEIAQQLWNQQVKAERSRVEIQFAAGETDSKTSQQKKK